MLQFPDTFRTLFMPNNECDTSVDKDNITIILFLKENIVTVAHNSFYMWIMCFHTYYM